MPGTPTTSTTVATAAIRIITEVRPDQAATFPITLGQFYRRPAIRRDIVAGAVRPRRDRSLEFDFPSEATLIGSAIGGFVLVVLNGAASGVLVELATGWLRRLPMWLRTRWFALRGRKLPPAGADAPLPRLPATQAAQVGALVRRLALRAGLPAELAQRLGTLVAAALTEPLGPAGDDGD
ncbi:MAG TPA: hypothetical protein VGD43_24020 [Micromonospora sp.]